MDDTLYEKYSNLAARVNNDSVEHRLSHMTTIMNSVLATLERSLTENSTTLKQALLTLQGNVNLLIDATKKLEDLERVSAKRQRR